jgi:histone-lysine N-methyltransferase SETD8
VRDTQGKGKGVFAVKEFKKGDLVCEYSGQLLNKKEADKQEKEYEGKPECGCYMYYFKFNGKTMCVDATKDNGQLGRLLNHSKTKANVVTKLFEIDRLPYLALLAKRDVSIGEELVYDYGERSHKVIQLFPWLQK